MGNHEWLRGLFVRSLLAVCVTCVPWVAQAKLDPAALREKHSALGEQLQNNPFGRPLVLESSDVSGRLTGDIYATVNYPLSQVSAGLDDPAHWCDVVSLHINTKYCRAEGSAGASVLRVRIGKKTAQDADDATPVDFAYRVASASSEYLDVLLNAREGPMGTSDYRIELEAVALPNARTFLHLTYSYAYNLAGKIAMKTYLGTIGRDKVGFTPTGTNNKDGQPEYVGGMRGLVERNAMRYYLAINAFLDSPGQTPAQVERRLQNWFSETEQYPRQLHEVERTQYMSMKREENSRRRIE